MKINWYFISLLLFISKILDGYKINKISQLTLGSIKNKTLTINKLNLIFLLSFVFVSFQFTINSDFIDYSEYFPVNQNMKWIYDVQEGGENYQQTVSMRQSESNSNSYLIKTNGRRKSELEYFILNGIVYLKNIKIDWGPLPFMISFSCSSPIPVFNLLATEKCFWTWKGSVNNLLVNKDIEVSYEYLNFEEIITPIGKYECLKVKTSYNEDSNKRILISWYAKGLGLIKEESMDYEKVLITFEKYK